MTSHPFNVRQANWNNDIDALRHVREVVFIQEQAVPQALEWDEYDTESLHMLAEESHGSPIGTGRLMPSGQIGRMAVLSNWRKCGVGSALLTALLKAAEEGNYPTPFLNAQIHAEAFYQKHGFRSVGEHFLEADIPHIRMKWEA